MSQATQNDLTEDDMPTGDARTPSQFEVETLRALKPVGNTLANLVKAVSSDIRKPIELQRALKLDSKLCWQVFNVIRSKGEIAAAVHVPGAPSMRRLLAAAKASGVAEDIIGSVRIAIKHYNEVIETHAPDRASFDSMVTTASSGDLAQATELFHRRNAFRSESHIWGMQMDGCLMSALIKKSETGNGTDECVLSHRIGMRRLRSDAPLVVFRYRHQNNMPVPSGPVRQPLDQASYAQYGAQLIAQYCSKPLPHLKSTLRESGWHEVELVGDAVGSLSSTNLLFGGYAINVPAELPYPTNIQIVGSTQVIFYPMALLVKDLLIHRPSFGAVTPELSVRRFIDGNVSSKIENEAQQLPTRDRITHLGRVTSSIGLSDFPDYFASLEYASQKLNWNLDEFDVYRVRIAYPILNTSVLMEFKYPV